MKHKGFTLIEVTLFLALTGLLFVGIILGTQNSLHQQRFLDSVQGYAEFLRGIYSEVSNTQSVGEGRSEVAIYGKLISFGQTYDLNGEKIEDASQRIFVYDVVGKVDSTTSSGRVLEILNGLDANVVVSLYLSSDGKSLITRLPVQNEGRGLSMIEPAGVVQTYLPRWNATIETDNENYVPYTGSILIVRHPRSGTINTLVYPGTDGIIEVNKTVKEANDVIASGGTPNVSTLLTAKLNEEDGFRVEDVDFCVDTEGIENANKPTNTPRERRNIRLVANARNASGVEIIDLNDYDDTDDGLRNKCMPRVTE